MSVLCHVIFYKIAFQDYQEIVYSVYLPLVLHMQKCHCLPREFWF